MFLAEWKGGQIQLERKRVARFTGRRCSMLIEQTFAPVACKRVSTHIATLSSGTGQEWVAGIAGIAGSASFCFGLKAGRRVGTDD